MHRRHSPFLICIVIIFLYTLTMIDYLNEFMFQLRKYNKKSK